MLGFTTERLVIEDWTPHRLDAVRRSHLETRLRDMLTPAVLRHLPPPLRLSDPDTTSAWIDARAAESEVALIRRRPDGPVLGLLILARFEASPPDIHIGYLFAEEAWGQGYATEMLVGVVAASPRPVRLLAGVEADNPASARVLAKAGFTPDASAGLYSLQLD